MLAWKYLDYFEIVDILSPRYIFGRQIKKYIIRVKKVILGAINLDVYQ